MLEGSVRKGGNRVRITAQLIDAETGAHLWADRFDGSMEDVFDLQDQVATSVAGVIEPALQAAEIRRARARPTGDLTAYDLYLRSGELVRAWSKEPTLRALELLGRAIERDPRYGIALALAGFCHSLLFCSGWADDPEATRRQGVALSQRALLASVADPVVLAYVALALTNFDQDVAPTIGLLDRSLALNPGSSFGWFASGWVRVVVGDADWAIADFATSDRLDPRSRLRPFILTGVGIAHFLAHRLDEAAATLLASIQQLPSYVMSYYYLAACYAHMGRDDDAREVFRRLTALTSPMADPPVIMPQPPEQCAFFLAGHRRALTTIA